MTHEKLAADCVLAAECLQETGTFETGQAILLDASKCISALSARVAELEAERDALVEAGMSCCTGTPNPEWPRSFLAISFIHGTRDAFKAADMLWKEYKARAEAAEAKLATAQKPVRTGLFDSKGREICLGDKLRHMNACKNTKRDYWFPEYEVMWDAPCFYLKHVGGGKPSDTGFAFRCYSREFETLAAIEGKTDDQL